MDLFTNSFIMDNCGKDNCVTFSQCTAPGFLDEKHRFPALLSQLGSKEALISDHWPRKEAMGSSGRLRFMRKASISSSVGSFTSCRLL